MSAMQRHGVAFSVVALAVAAGSQVLARLPPQLEAGVLAALILFFGVPHGALDTVLVHRHYRVQAARDWLGFAALYLLLAGLSVCAWLLAPGVLFVFFLLISVAHFSGDLSQGTPVPSRLLYGGAVVVLPSLLGSAEVQASLGLLADPATATRIVSILHAAATPWLVALLLAALLRARRDPLCGAEMASAALLTTLATPLLAFTIFFCGMHSARHILRTFDGAVDRRLRPLLLAAGLPMTGTLLLGALAWHALRGATFDARLTQVLFVGLAALTIPHLAVVEPLRLAGWPHSTRNVR